jgi:hypothetical protein
MDHVQFGRWRLCCDREMTRRAYTSIAQGGAEACGCAYCRNFILARPHVIPSEAFALFERLGVDVSKEAEVYQTHPLRLGLHAYGGWLHFVGAIEQGADALTPSGVIELEPLGPTFSLGFTNRLALVPASFAALPTCQVEFAAKVPWLLEDEEPDLSER